MKKEPLFSIITVVFNDAENLDKTIKSLLAQSCKDFEFIVIDGGSKDSSVEIIKKHEEQITYWISEPDKGIYDAMNKGIKRAKGEFLHFLNAGDAYFDKDTLLKLKKKVWEEPQAEIFYGKTVYSGKNSYNIKGKKISLLDAYFSIPFCHQSMFFKRALFLELGFYDTSFKYAADYAWMSKYLKLRKQLNSMAFLAFPVSVYMDGGASFVNMQLVLRERARIAKMYFPIHFYLAFLTLIPVFHFKIELLQIMIRLNILSYYRQAKHRLSLPF